MLAGGTMTVQKIVELLMMACLFFCPSFPACNKSDEGFYTFSELSPIYLKWR